MGTIPNPAIGPLRTPPAIQGSVIALRTAGKSKRSIAKELGIDRKTVDNVLEVFRADTPNYSLTVQELTTKAFVRVQTAIDAEKDTDTARWALEHTVFRPEQGDSLHVHGDATFQAAIGLLPGAAQPSTTSTAATHSSPDGTSTGASGATEAAAKAPGGCLDLSSHTNFSQFSDADLEAELARRRAARPALEAEIVG